MEEIRITKKELKKLRSELFSESSKMPEKPVKNELDFSSENKSINKTNSKPNED